jgi:hypothetical protein
MQSQAAAETTTSTSQRCLNYHKGSGEHNTPITNLLSDGRHGISGAQNSIADTIERVYQCKPIRRDHAALANSESKMRFAECCVVGSGITIDGRRAQQ